MGGGGVGNEDVEGKARWEMQKTNCLMNTKWPLKGANCHTSEVLLSNILNIQEECFTMMFGLLWAC